jgi:hypothetical protein
VFIVAGLGATVLLMLWARSTRRRGRSRARTAGWWSWPPTCAAARPVRSLLQNSSDAQAILDADGRIRFEASPGTGPGYPASDWEGRLFASLVTTTIVAP